MITPPVVASIEGFATFARPIVSKGVLMPVVKVGLSARTIPPVPVVGFASEIVSVPEVVIGEFVTVKIEGATRPTEDT